MKTSPPSLSRPPRLNCHRYENSSAGLPDAGERSNRPRPEAKHGRRGARTDQVRPGIYPRPERVNKVCQGLDVYKRQALCMYFPSSSRPKSSNEKVEKVVNAPHTPTCQNSPPRGGRPASRTLKKPISTAPTRLISNVRMGKSHLTGTRLTRYRKTAPSAPPKPTNIKSTPFTSVWPHTAAPPRPVSHARGCILTSSAVATPSLSLIHIWSTP